MNTLIATNVLLAVIVLCIIILTIMSALFLVHAIGIARRIKYIVKTFDDDVHRARSVVLAVKDMIAERIGLTKKHHK